MRLALSTRVFLGFLVILLVFAGTVTVGLFRMHAIRESLRYTADNYVSLTRNLAQIKTLLDIRDDYTERALGEADPRLRVYLVRYARDFYPLAIRNRLAEAKAALSRSLPGSVTDGERRFLTDAIDRIGRMEELETQAEEALASLFDRPDLVDEDRLALRDTARERAAALVKEARLLSLNLDERVAQSVLRAERDENDAVWALITLSLLAVVVGVLITWWVARSLRPLQQLGDTAHALSKGSYDVQIAENAAPEVANVANELRALASALREREAALARGTEELTRLKAFLESVLASARASIVVTDGQLKIRRINHAARNAFQLGISDYENRALEELPLWSVLKDHVEKVRRAAGGGEGVHLNAVSLARGDGSELVLDIDVEPLRDPRSSSPVSGVVVQCTDVTERERARERLTTTERLAAVGHLAAQVAHEIRNPLSSIGLNCALLEDELEAVTGPRAPEVRSLLRAIGKEIDRLAEMTEGYLKHARMGRGRAGAVDLNALVEDLATLVRDDFRRKGITLTIALNPECGFVRADAARLRQVLLNLVRNASEAVARRQQSNIRVSTERDGDSVRLVVDDNGPGVPEPLRDRIFEPFFTTKESGSGLGLSGSRAAVEEYGGTLVCRESPDGGARFIATLHPASPGAEDEAVDAVVEA